MAHVTRRFFLLSSAALSAGCAIGGQPRADGTPTTAQNVRQPVAGQSWRYAKHDLYTKRVVDEQVDRVATVNSSVEIDSSYKSAGKERPAPTDGAPTYCASILCNHRRPAENCRARYRIPGAWWWWIRIGAKSRCTRCRFPCGRRNWSQAGRAHISTRYKTPADQDSLPWDQTMRAQAWETVTVPAGRFKALRFTNEIKFTHHRSFTDGFREARNAYGSHPKWAGGSLAKAGELTMLPIRPSCSPTMKTASGGSFSSGRSGGVLSSSKRPSIAFCGPCRQKSRGCTTSPVLFDAAPQPVLTRLRRTPT